MWNSLYTGTPKCGTPSTLEPLNVELPLHWNPNSLYTGTPKCGTPSTLEPLNVELPLHWNPYMWNSLYTGTPKCGTPSTLEPLNVELPLHWNPYMWNSLYHQSSLIRKKLRLNLIISQACFHRQALQKLQSIHQTSLLQDDWHTWLIYPSSNHFHNGFKPHLLHSHEYCYGSNNHSLLFPMAHQAYIYPSSNQGFIQRQGRGHLPPPPPPPSSPPPHPPFRKSPPPPPPPPF